VCQIRLESRLESPEDRSDLRHPNLKGWVRENRPRLLSAALTVLRAYHQAGRPDQKLKTWGSYESWSALIRGAIVWAGWSDPYQSREGMKQAGDSRIQAMRILLGQWGDLDAKRNELTCREIIEIVEKEEPPAKLADLIEAIAVLSPPSKAGSGRCARLCVSVVLPSCDRRQDAYFVRNPQSHEALGSR
jgi:hypothetical protein